MGDSMGKDQPGLLISILLLIAWNRRSPCRIVGCRPQGQWQGALDALQHSQRRVLHFWTKYTNNLKRRQIQSTINLCCHSIRAVSYIVRYSQECNEPWRLTLRTAHRISLTAPK